MNTSAFPGQTLQPLPANSGPVGDDEFSLLQKIAQNTYNASQNGGSSSSEFGVDVASYATGGTGTSANPWTGWDTAITWTEFTQYNFRKGYYRYVTSPNFGLNGLELVGGAGVYLVHSPTSLSNAVVFDAGAGSIWSFGCKMSGFNISGTPTALTGTVSVANGGTALTGIGTAFLTQLPVGSAITFGGGGASARSYVVTAVADNQNATISSDVPAVQAEVNQTATVCLSKNGLYLRGMRNGKFDFNFVTNVAQAAMWTEACVTNSCRGLHVSDNDGYGANLYYLCRPKYGIVTYTRGAAEWTTCWTFEEAIIEAVQFIGVWLRRQSYGSVFLNGTSENNSVHVGATVHGVWIDGINNTFIGFDVENNSGYDFYIQGSENILDNCECDGTSSIQTGTADGSAVDGSYNKLRGSVFGALGIGSGCLNNRLEGCRYNSALTDNGNQTIYPTINANDARSYLGILSRKQNTITVSGGNLATDCKFNDIIYCETTGAVTVTNPTNPRVSSSLGTCTLDMFLYATGATTLSWGTDFSTADGLPLPASITSGKSVYLKFIYQSINSSPKWVLVSSASYLGQATLAANTFTGVQTLPNGAVGAPAINFGDATSGIYRSASNELSVALAGTQRFQFKSDTFYSDVFKPMSGSTNYFDGTNSIFRGAFLFDASTLSGAGAIPITRPTCYFTSTGGAQALTLANGGDGQVLTILHVVDGGSGVLTPTTPAGFSNITFNAVGDSVTLQYKASIGWFIIGSRGVVIA